MVGDKRKHKDKEEPRLKSRLCNTKEFVLYSIDGEGPFCNLQMGIKLENLRVTHINVEPIIIYVIKLIFGNCILSD